MTVNKKIWSILYFLIPYFIFSSCVRNSNDLIEHNKGDMLKKFYELGLSLQLDSNIQVESKRPVEDFILYKLFFKGTLMSIYVGNHPQFPNGDIPQNITSNELTINGLKVISYNWNKYGKLFSGQYLIDMSKYKAFPQYVHFSFFDVTKTIKEKFEFIINSIELNNYNGDGH